MDLKREVQPLLGRRTLVAEGLVEQERLFPQIIDHTPNVGSDDLCPFRRQIPSPKTINNWVGLA